MIKNLFNQKKASSNKRGSMLTLVLVILAMALILITSAITITSSTRGRYIDNTLSAQARATATSVAETMCTAIMNQDILDSELVAMASGNVTVSAVGTGGTMPAGLRSGITDTVTTLTFSKDSNYIYMDVVTKIGTFGNGNQCVESVRVYFKHKEPVRRSILFDHMMEVGQDCSFGQFHVGTGAPAGAKNTVFAHSGLALTNQGGNTIDSTIYVTGATDLGNGGNYKDIIFAGNAAGFKNNGGQVNIENLAFIAPSGTGIGKVSTGTSQKFDMSVDNVIFYNFDVNAYIVNHSTNYYGEPGTSTNVQANLPDGGSVVMSNGMTATAADAVLNAELANKAQDYLDKAVAALDTNSAFPTLSSVSGTFLDGVTVTTDQGDIPETGDEDYNKPGVYHLQSKVTGTITFDLSVPGGYVLKCDQDCEITGTIYFKNGNQSASQMGNWGRIIIGTGKTLKIGGADCGSSVKGLLAANHAGSKQVAAGTKPTCFIYGNDNSRVVLAGGKYSCDAYIGMYGTTPSGVANVYATGENYICGRISATEFKGENMGAGSYLPYCPGPHEDSAANVKTPKVSDYEIVRFRYYYGTI